ncbi:type VI secretion system tube protein TssD [Chromobacterium sp. ASV23]|uniref:Hcp family type VI secretion system effector n=1 Tax=Chromobacterium sp. ASV23 TaxID=2795110 RepID=UPI0018EC276A|nr:type VI secretion system tube protein TssD [Chromobacterium sp. ASV23]
MDAIILDLGSDIKGECKLTGYADKIEVLSYSHNVALQVTNQQNSERTSGKAYLGEFSLTKFTDKSTPSLNSYCCQGKNIPEAKIIVGRNAAKSDKEILPYIVYTLTNAIISNVSVSGGTGGKPVENLSLNFTKIKWEITTQKDTGEKEGTSAASWGLVENALG